MATTILVTGVVALGAWGVPAPPSFTVEHMPRIGWRHVWRSLAIVDRFKAQRQFAGWAGHGTAMFVAFGTTNRIHRLDAPGREPTPVEGIPEGAFGMRGSRDVERPWVVYALDAGGSERYRFHRYDLATGTSTALTPHPARAYAAGIDHTGTWLAFTSNVRNGTDSDVYVVDVAAASAPRAVFTGGGDLWLSGWTGDGRLLVHRHVGIGRSRSFLLDPSTGHTRPVLAAGTGEHVVAAAVSGRKPGVMYVAADLDGEFVGLHALDLVSGDTTPLLPDLSWDVVDVEAMADGRTLALIVNEDARHRVMLFDLEQRTLTPLADGTGGFPTRIAAHPTRLRLAIDSVDPGAVSGVWSYDLASGTFVPWAVEHVGEPTPSPQVIHYPTFDTAEDGSTRLISAVVLPPREPMPAPQPVLIDLHGGPSGQALARPAPPDTVPGPRPVIIRPNVRGSTGYGRTFEALDDGVGRHGAVRDVGALLDWIATQPDLDHTRVAIMGASYGGYLTLATLAAYPDRVRCGVDMFGISDLPAFLEESEHGHFGEAQRGEYGDRHDASMRRQLVALSPITHAERMRMPLLIYQGANDIRVKPSQSRSLVDRVRTAGGDVTYLEVPNEGHSLRQPLTQFYFGVAMLEFLGRCLG